MRGDANLYVEDFPPDLHRRAKAVAALQGRHLRLLIIAAVQREVELAEALAEVKRSEAGRV